MSTKTTQLKQVEKKVTRREFVRNMSIVLGGVTILPGHVLGRGVTAPNDKINLGFIGLGKQGNILANFFVNNTQAQIVAGSDVWNGKREAFKQNVESLYAEQRGQAKYEGVATYLDYRELLARKDIDAVVIATPDHWHGIQTVDAIKAGKDVFCEKPLANTIAEGRAIVDAVNQYDAVFQTGSMQRSWAIFQTAVSIVQSGKLGEIETVLVNVGDPAIPYNLEPQPTPDGVDWNLWCGPADLIGYHNSIAPKIVKTYPDWRFFEETGGGILSDWGAHMFDVAQWCLGMDHTGPVHYIPPNDLAAKRGLKMIYENGTEMIHKDFGRGFAVRFIGTEGEMDVSRSILETTPTSILPSVTKRTKEEIKGDYGNHYQDWISAIKTRGEAICPAETGHRTSSICNVANIAYDLHRPLEWDPVKEQFKGDKEANKMRKRTPRNYQKVS